MFGCFSHPQRRNDSEEKFSCLILSCDTAVFLTKVVIVLVLDFKACALRTVLLLLPVQNRFPVNFETTVVVNPNHLLLLV